MLHRVVSYADSVGLKSEPGFARKSAKWAVSCDDQGHFTGILPLVDGKQPRDFDLCPHLAQNELIAGGKTRSQFLVESLQTVALYVKDRASQREVEKARAKHEYFVELLERASKDVPPLACAARVLRSEDELEAIRTELSKTSSPKPKPTDTTTLWVDGSFPLESEQWHDWWRAFRAGLRAESRNDTMRCLLTGESVVPVATHPKVTGLAGVGGLGTGDVIIGFDKDAFQSYGLEKSANAAVSEDAATQYVETLNRLVKEHGIKFGDALVTYWFTHSISEPDDLFAFLSAGESDARKPGVETLPRKLLNSIRSGERQDLAGNNYCAMTMSGASGRVMIRDWMEGQFTELVEHVDQWFSDLDIVARDGKGLAPLPKFLAVVGGLERAIENASAPSITQLWKSAVTASPIPYAAHAKALLRCRVDVVLDAPANHARMGLIKAWHRRNHGDEIMQAYLNPEHPSPAYQCGRLLAVLARLQYAALGPVGAGVVQRYYTAASQAPALTLGRLMSNAKNHLGKLEGGLPRWFEGHIAEIMTRIRDEIPTTLDLREQSLFALGYYQQLAALLARKDKDEQPDEQLRPGEVT
ncbi:MAG: type I-C CRISPR-associated protein Cas8c/Csd1 [Gammaproteobacteria bacterium]